MAKKKLPEKLNICFISQKLPRSQMGADYGYLWPLCINLTKLGHRVTIITRYDTGKQGTPIPEGIRIQSVDWGDLAAGLHESLLDRLEQLILEEPFDLIHVIDSSGSDIVLNKKSLKVPVAMGIKGINLDRIFGIIGLTEETVSSYLSTSLSVASKFIKSFYGTDRKLLKKADGIFVTTEEQSDILERFYQIPSAKVFVIPYGIDAKSFEPVRTREEVVKQLDLPEDVTITLTNVPLNTVQEAKNLLTAYQKVVIKKPNNILLVMGAGQKRFELEAHTLNLALGSKVHFLDVMEAEQVNRFINACDIYVNLLSRVSGFEQSVLEAMASKKLVIASDVGTSRQVIQHGISGFLIRPADIETLTRVLFEAVSGHVDFETICNQARLRVLNLFNTTQMVDQTIEAYKKILLRSGYYKR